MDIKHDHTLISACGFPQYTNYVSNFIGCLDYIYVEPSKLNVEEVIPMCSHEEVIQYTALPNAVFPSDHLALVCELSFINPP